MLPDTSRARILRGNSSRTRTTDTIPWPERLCPSFVVHEHHARTRHFDLRLEHGGVLASWAVPKGVPEKPGAKHLAIRTEDHPLEYRDFEGTIPEGEYGAGEVTVWDRGTFEPLKWEEDRIEVVLHGGRLQGKYVLIPFRRAGAGQWLVLKAKDG